ncbi:unnamed protein product, partial [Rotaria magnacalcarata]
NAEQDRKIINTNLMDLCVYG